MICQTEGIVNTHLLGLSGKKTKPCVNPVTLPSHYSKELKVTRESSTTELKDVTFKSITSTEQSELCGNPAVEFVVNSLIGSFILLEMISPYHFLPRTFLLPPFSHLMALPHGSHHVCNFSCIFFRLLYPILWLERRKNNHLCFHLLLLSQGHCFFYAISSAVSSGCL